MSAPTASGEGRRGEVTWYLYIRGPTFFLIRGPAWSKSGPMCRSMYGNSGYMGDEVDHDDDDRSVADMLAELQCSIETAESGLSTWRDIRAAAETDALLARKVDKHF